MGIERNHVIIKAVLEQGMSVSAAAARFKVSRQWIYVLLERYQQDGVHGLEPRSRAPLTRPQTTSEAVKERVIALRTELVADGADAGAGTIAWHLGREGLTVPAESTIRRILTNAGLISPEPRKRPRSSYRRFEAELPNECWQADITYWPLLDGTRVEILDFLDDHSRFLLHIRAERFYTGAMVTAAMQGLIEAFGAPAETLTDNGLVFTSRLTGNPGAKNGFEKLLAAHSIRQKNGKPAHPQTQGKIERFHQTLKRWLRTRPRAADLAELNEQLEQFRHWYNTARPHRACGRRTPEQAYTAQPKASPATPAATEYRTRADRVDAQGKVSLRYAGRLRHLGIGRKYAGTAVLLLIDGEHVSTSDATTGEVIAEHTIDPTKGYQPRTR
jgi:transposase InsO family protein